MGRSVRVILQVIPEKQAFRSLTAAVRKLMADELFKELIDKVYSEKLQGYEFRFVGGTDSVTQVMIEKREDLPWKDIREMLQKLEWDVLRDIRKKGGLRLNIQQCKETSASLALASESRPGVESQ